MKTRTTRKAVATKPATRRSAPAVRPARPSLPGSVRPGSVRPVRKLSSPHPADARAVDSSRAVLQATGAGPSTGVPTNAAASRMAPRFPEDDYDYSYLRDFLGQTFVPGACRAVVFGCGKGEEAVHLSERGYRVTGLDADRNAVGLARERAWLNSRDVDFMIGDVFESANLLPAESFGLASDRGVFRAIARNGAAGSHGKKGDHRSGDGNRVPDDDRDRRKFLDLVRRLLLPGGVFLLNATEVDPARRGRAPRKKGKPRGQNDLLVQEGGEVMGEVLRAGLEIVGRRLYPVPPPSSTDGDGDGTRGPSPSEGTGKQILLLYCRK